MVLYEIVGGLILLGLVWLGLVWLRENVGRKAGNQKQTGGDDHAGA